MDFTMFNQRSEQAIFPPFKATGQTPNADVPFQKSVHGLLRGPMHAFIVVTDYYTPCKYRSTTTSTPSPSPAQQPPNQRIFAPKIAALSESAAEVPKKEKLVVLTMPLMRNRVLEWGMA
jgi:hypothetical protein